MLVSGDLHSEEVDSEENDLETWHESVSGTGLKGKHVLVVDDVFFNQEIACLMLQSFGVEVIEAENGIDALKKLDQEIEGKGIDLILMDMQMPEMDGYEASRIIKTDPKYNNVTIIALTANALIEDKQKCLDAGTDDYLAKPFDAEFLVKKVVHWLSRSRDAAQ